MEEYQDLSKDFVSVIDPDYHVKFFSVDENLEIKEIVKEIKEQNTIILVDLKKVIEEPSTVRILVNKIKRISDEYNVTMKLYGKSWLLIIPSSVKFIVGDE